MNSSSIRVIREISDLEIIRGAWNALVANNSHEILHLDVSSTFEWNRTLLETRLKMSGQQIFALEHHGMLSSIFPFYIFRGSMYHLPYNCLTPISSLYGLRMGFIALERLREDLEVCLEFLYHDLPGWDVFEVTLVDGAPSGIAFKEYVVRKGHFTEIDWQGNYPFMPLDGTWDEYFNGLSKKFRAQLRTHEKKLHQCGEVSYRCCIKDDDREFFPKCDDRS